MNCSGNLPELLRRIALFALTGFLAVTLAGPVLALLSTLFTIGLSLALVALCFALIGLPFWLVWRLLAPVTPRLCHRVAGVVPHAFYGLSKASRRVSRSAWRATRHLSGVAREQTPRLAQRMANVAEQGARGCRRGLHWVDVQARRGGDRLAELRPQVDRLGEQLKPVPAAVGRGLRYAGTQSQQWVASSLTTAGIVLLEVGSGALVGLALTALTSATLRPAESALIFGGVIGAVLGFTIGIAQITPAPRVEEAQLLETAEFQPGHHLPVC